MIWPLNKYPDSKVHVANIGPTWVLSAQAGPHVGPVNLAIRVIMLEHVYTIPKCRCYNRQTKYEHKLCQVHLTREPPQQRGYEC